MIAISDYTNDWTATTAGTTDAFISYDGTGNHVVESYIWACVDDVADGQIEIAKAKDLYIKKERPKSNIHYAFVGNKLQIKNEGFVFPFRGSSKKDDVLQKWIFIKKNKVYSQG